MKKRWERKEMIKIGDRKIWEGSVRKRKIQGKRDCKVRNRMLEMRKTKKLEREIRKKRINKSYKRKKKERERKKAK